MKQRFVCLILALALAVPLAASAAEKSDTGSASPAWSAACKAFVLENGYRKSDQTWYDTAPAFALHDMDGDGIPELLARNNADTAADRTAYVYTASYSSLQYAGSAGVSGPADRFAPGSGYPGLYQLTNRNGVYEGVYYTLSGGRVAAETVLTAEQSGNSGTVTQKTRYDSLFAAFRPEDAARLLQAPGEVLAYQTIDEIRAMGWDAFVSASLAADNTRFKDVSLAHWAWVYTDYVCSKGLMTGTGDGAFTPAGYINRAQVVTILYRLEGSPLVNGGKTFSDVPEDSWYGTAVRWAVGVKIADPEEDGRFRPGRTMERQELAQMLYRYAQYKGSKTPAAVAIFPDWDQVRDDCVEAMYWAVGAGLINGTGDGRLDPTGSLTRAQLAAMLQRFCENVLGK